MQLELLQQSTMFISDHNKFITRTWLGISENGSLRVSNSHIIIPKLYTSTVSLYSICFPWNNSGAIHNVLPISPVIFCDADLTRLNPKSQTLHSQSPDTFSVRCKNNTTHYQQVQRLQITMNHILRMQISHASGCPKSNF